MTMCSEICQDNDLNTKSKLLKIEIYSRLSPAICLIPTTAHTSAIISQYIQNFCKFPVGFSKHSGK